MKENLGIQDGSKSQNRLNIIHDTRAFDRLGDLKKELYGQKIFDYKIWSPVEDSKSVVRSINLSHKQIVKKAKQDNLPYVIIGEDDLKFTSEGAWEFFMKNMPQSFDLYMSSTYIIPATNKMVCGFHLYIVSNNFYDTFLGVPEDVHIDSEMNNINGNYHFCYPFPALQRKGFSFNNKCVVDYNTVLKECDIYNAAIHNI